MLVNLNNKTHIIEVNRRNTVVLVSVVILCLIHSLPFLFIGSDKATLFGNQIKILCTFLGAIVLFLVQGGKTSFYYIFFLLFLYFLSGFLLYFSALGFHFFRALSLSYILVAYVGIVIFQYRISIDIKKIQKIFSFIQILVLLFVFIRFFSLKDTSFYIRPHGLIIVYIILEVAGLRLGRLNALILLIATLLMSYFSYNSRIAQIVVFLIVINEFGFKKVMLYFTPLFLITYFNSDLFARFSDNGIEDFGRAYIYECIFNNFSKLNYFLPTYSGLESCYTFEYLHSSFLILIVEYGSILGLFFILLSFFIFTISLFKKHKYYPSFWIFISIFLFSSVEGGMEWFYLFILWISFNKIRSRYFDVAKDLAFEKI
jgi:hypothetical protein